MPNLVLNCREQIEATCCCRELVRVTASCRQHGTELTVVSRRGVNEPTLALRIAIDHDATTARFAEICLAKIANFESESRHGRHLLWRQAASHPTRLGRCDD